MFKNHPAYNTVGFQHIEDLSGTWGVKEGHSLYTQHLQKLGLLKGLQRYLAELEPLPDQERRFIAESLPLPAEEYIDPFIGRRVARYIDGYETCSVCTIVAVKQLYFHGLVSGAQKWYTNHTRRLKVCR